MILMKMTELNGADAEGKGEDEGEQEKLQM
jgi:hypothetical protein